MSELTTHDGDGVVAHQALIKHFLQAQEEISSLRAQLAEKDKAIQALSETLNDLNGEIDRLRMVGNRNMISINHLQRLGH